MPLRDKESEMGNQAFVTRLAGLPKVHRFDEVASPVVTSWRGTVGRPRFIEHQNILMNGDPDVPNPIYVFDLDGTIADINHRVHFIQKPKWKDRDYDKFFSEVVNDSPVEFVIDLMRRLPIKNIYITSGRSSQCIFETIEWLHNHCVPFNRIYMRAEKNYEKDHILKLSMVEPFKEKIMFIVDDRQIVVDAWRENGFNVMQVNQWEEYNDKG